MIRENFKHLIESGNRTLLGVGPMSRNCVDATIELANEHDTPLMLIASRRQIDSSEFGGGYVENWSTEEFARYVADRDPAKKVILARDHGGPWQNNKEVQDNLSLAQAMASAKRSYEVDIASGLQVIHIDPSIDIHGTPSIDAVLERVFELYDHCWSVASRLKKEIVFEIGTEEQTGHTDSVAELDYSIQRVIEFCAKNKIPSPLFIVMQTGTRVMEMRNVGTFDSLTDARHEMPAHRAQFEKMSELSRKYGVYIKAHNTDYLLDESLSWHPRLGIHAANVAPEFGVAESRALVHMLRDHGMQELADHFLKVSLESGKWKKWMVPNTLATDEERGLIAGHYTFGSNSVVDLRKEASRKMAHSGIDLEKELKGVVKASIHRYLKHFGLLRS